jgi:hypothetical protein
MFEEHLVVFSSRLYAELYLFYYAFRIRASEHPKITWVYHEETVKLATQNVRSEP